MSRQFAAAGSCHQLAERGLAHQLVRSQYYIKGGGVPSELSLRDKLLDDCTHKKQQKESRQTYVSLKSSFYQLSKTQHFKDIE